MKVHFWRKGAKAEKAYPNATEEELEQAYRIKERRYLEEDFANTLADTAQNPDTRFHNGQLEEFPELTDWLCECFDHFYDANMSHNDLMELTVNHLHHASLTPEFFTRLALKAPAFCNGLEKQPQDCEKNCSRYYRCSDITIADERSKRWETLSSLLAMHIHGGCTCSKGSEETQCPAAKYLHGEWDISEFSMRKKDRRRSDEKTGENKRANPYNHSEGRK